jgi:hypothetical protein
MSRTMTENGELHNWTTFAITMIIALRLKYEDNSASPHQENPKITYFFLNELIWLKFRIKPF